MAAFERTLITHDRFDDFLKGDLKALNAEELRGLKDYNENILESMDSGILVLDLEGQVARWNRAMEALYGRKAYLRKAESDPVHAQVAGLRRRYRIADRRSARLTPPREPEQLSLVI